MALAFTFQSPPKLEEFGYRIQCAIEKKALRNIKLSLNRESCAATIDLTHSYDPIGIFLTIVHLINDEHCFTKYPTRISFMDILAIEVDNGIAITKAWIDGTQACYFAEYLEAECIGLELPDNIQFFARALSAAGKPYLGMRLRSLVGYNNAEMRKGERWNALLNPQI